MSERMDSCLHTWAISLTRHHKVFSRDHPLIPEHFSKLTCDTNLQPVLSYLVRHVRSPEERRLIKLNLKQARFRKQVRDGQEMSASEERFKIKAAVVDAVSAVDAEVTEIQQLSQKKEELRQKEVEIKRRTMLMKVVWEERNKEVCLWEQIRVTLDNWNPRVLLDGILSEVRESTRRLHSQVQLVDLARDARELRLKCESDGSFIDEMNPGGVIESVRELLGQMSAAHVKLYVEAHQADQAALSLTRAISALNNNIASVARRTYCEDALATAVINMVKENISLAGEHAALNTAQALTASLQERADVAARARDAVTAKHAKIMSFNKEVQDGVESIQCLAVNIRGGWLSIKDHLGQLKSSISETLSCTTYPTPTSPHSLSNECEVFTSVPLSYLLTTNIEECEMKQKARMSTTSLMWYDQDTVEAGWEALSQLCSGMHCWEDVYNTVHERLNMAHSFHIQMEQLGTVREAMSSVQKKTQILSSQEMKELSMHVEENDKTLHEEVTHLTETLEQMLSTGSKNLTVVNNLITDWWEQPAKSIKIIGTS
ncbi:uncharacterized protein [Cherax quadricarinatus]|uniref:uncharacterized protein isoform X3 n=1 Tax=Cherax quadricarinatus TaxID=27406 RepID=UPI00387EA2CB